MSQQNNINHGQVYKLILYYKDVAAAKFNKGLIDNNLQRMYNGNGFNGLDFIVDGECLIASYAPNIESLEIVARFAQGRDPKHMLKRYQII